MTRLRALAYCSIFIAAVFVAAGCSGGGSGNPPPPTITSVMPACAHSVAEGQSVQCWANVQGMGNFNSAITWSSSVPNTISTSGLFTAPSTVGPVTVTATSVADTSKSGSEAMMVVLPQRSGFPYGGIHHVSWSANEYNTPVGTASQDALAATSANWAGLLATWYQADKSATSIAPISSTSPSTPTDAAVIAPITELHNQHVNVMLKPMVDATNNPPDWRGTFQPSDVNAWFASFTTFITHYAQIAQANNVEMLCFGTEYVQLSKANLSNWTNVINAIRAVYKGPLAYAANATYATDEFPSVVFWDQIDVIGLDAYFPLTSQDNPTVAQLVSAWSMNRGGENIVQDVLNFAGAHPTKPVIFSEIGYRSIAGTNVAPWDWSDVCPNPADQNIAANCPVDDTEQANAYEAMYEVWHNTVMKGNFWWAWPVPPPNVATDTDYNPRDKPAQTVLQNWQ